MRDEEAASHPSSLIPHPYLDPARLLLQKMPAIPGEAIVRVVQRRRVRAGNNGHIRQPPGPPGLGGLGGPLAGEHW